MQNILEIDPYECHKTQMSAKLLGMMFINKTLSSICIYN